MGYQPAAEYQQANEPTGKMQRFQLTNLAQITQLCVSLVWYAGTSSSACSRLGTPFLGLLGKWYFRLEGIFLLCFFLFFSLEQLPLLFAAFWS